jgi:hypothetical protein
MAGIKARSRPRVRSVNFRRVWWWVLREAAVRIWFPYASDPYSSRALRRRLCGAQRSTILAISARWLALHPERRTWPPQSP